MQRQQKQLVKINNKTIGKNMPILIQSMTNTKTKDINATLMQINDLKKAGADIVRVAVLDEKDALAIKKIKEKTDIPIVADIHFDYRLALLSIDSGVDKLRINPGNIGSIDKIAKVVSKCKEHNIPIRIGVNSGSLEKDILEKYGSPCAEALVESAKRHVKILEDLDFHDIVISIKSSDVLSSVEAYRLANATFNYPLHIGITESGSKYAGSIKSSVGLGILLNEGIGDTIRVSLCCDPVEEVKTAIEILSALDLYTKPKLIACPSCGRTEYNIIDTVTEIEEYLTNYPKADITVAIMGCVVNGPGEAREADIGVAGGKGYAVLFANGEIIKKISEEDIIPVLKCEIDKIIKAKQTNI